MKIPDCDRCLLYAHNPHIICTIHPYGVDTDECADFRPNPNIKPEEQWSPEGYSWYDGELIPNRPSRYTQEEQLEILDTHPCFTGICPNCGYRFNPNNRIVHYDCPVCNFVDDSV
jgi:hypothetical protein